VGLKDHHAARHPPLASLARQECQHRLVAAVYAIKVADGQRARGRQGGIIATDGKTMENFHARVTIQIE
jgi:hypothetical protein